MSGFHQFWLNFFSVLEGRDGQVDIQFLPGCSNFECYPESGMKATVVGYTPVTEDGVFKLKVDYTRYDDYNKKFETSNYYRTDDSGKRVADLSAREAGFYKVKDELYVDASTSYHDYFKVCEIPKSFQKYEIEKKLFAFDLTYVQWLEKKYEEKYET